MKWAALVSRVLVGLMFVVFGLNGLLPQPFIELPKPPEPALTFIGLLVTSGYLKVVKLLEVFGGALLLSGRLVPLGVTVLSPIALNILLYELFLLGQPGPGFLLVPLLAFLVWAYRPYFAPLFTVDAATGRPSGLGEPGA